MNQKRPRSSSNSPAPIPKRNRNGEAGHAATQNEPEEGNFVLASDPIYIPLRDPSRQIRLLQMIARPGRGTGNDDDDEAEVEQYQYKLVNVEDFSGVAFSAISYQWGTEGPQGAVVPVITVDERPLRVLPNCHRALAQVYRLWCRSSNGVTALRMPQPPLSEFVWVDSICINQKDNAEKNCQVAIMGQIYAAAQHVFACVGPEAGDSAVLLEKAWEAGNAGLQFPCVHCHTDGGLRRGDGGDGRNSDRGSGSSSDSSHDGDNNKPDSDGPFTCRICGEQWTTWVRSHTLYDINRLASACVAFGQRSYWSRVWIVQEIVKATDPWVLCGNDGITWTLLRDLQDFLIMGLDELPDLFQTFESLPSILLD